MGSSRQQDYGTYDRVLDWFTDNRQLVAKVFVLVAIVGMVATAVLSAVLV